MAKDKNQNKSKNQAGLEPLQSIDDDVLEARFWGKSLEKTAIEASQDVDFSEFDAQATVPELDAHPSTAYPLPQANNKPTQSDLDIDESPAGLDFFGQADSSSPLLITQAEAAPAELKTLEQGRKAEAEREAERKAKKALEDEFFSTSPQAEKTSTPSSAEEKTAKSVQAALANAGRNETRFAVAVISALEPRLSTEAQDALWSLVNKIDEALDAVIRGRMQSLRWRLAESKKIANISAGMQRDSALLSLIIVPQLSFAKQLFVVVIYDPQQAKKAQAHKAMREVQRNMDCDDLKLRWRLCEPEGAAGPVRRLAASGIVLHGLIPVEFFREQIQLDSSAYTAQKLRNWGLLRGCVNFNIIRSHSRVHPLAGPKRALATALWRWAVHKQMHLSAAQLRTQAQTNEGHALWLDRDALFTAACAPLLADDNELREAVAKLIPILHKGAAGRALLRIFNLPQPLFSVNAISREEVFLPFELIAAGLGIATDLALEADLNEWMRLRRPRDRFYPRSVLREIFGAKSYDRVQLRRRSDAAIEALTTGDMPHMLSQGPLVEDALAKLWTNGYIEQANKLRPSAELLDRQPRRILKALIKSDLAERAGLLCLTTRHAPSRIPKLSELDVEAVWLALDRGSARVQDLGRQQGFAWLDVCVQHHSANLRVLAMGGRHAWVLAELVQSVLDALRDGFDVLFEHGDGLALLDHGGVQILQGPALQRRMARPGAVGKVRVIGSSPLVQLVRKTAKQSSDSIHIFLGREAGVAVLDAQRRAYLRPGKKAQTSQTASDLLDFLKKSAFRISATVHDAQQFYAQPLDQGLPIRLVYDHKILQSLWIADQQVPLLAELDSLCAQEILARSPARQKSRFYIESMPGFSRSPVLALRARSLFTKKITNKINRLKNSFKKT